MPGKVANNYEGNNKDKHTEQCPYKRGRCPTLFSIIAQV